MFFEGCGQKELCLFLFSNWQSTDKPPEPRGPIEWQWCIHRGVGNGGGHRLQDTNLRQETDMHQILSAFKRTPMHTTPHQTQCMLHCISGLGFEFSKEEDVSVKNTLPRCTVNTVPVYVHTYMYTHAQT